MLPQGTVTFLFTDVEGSTRLLHELGDGYADALAEHRRLLRDAFARHGGVEVDTQGDAFFVAFAKASDALAAAADGCEALGDGPIRVRMGLHTGEPKLIGEGYVGIDVHRAARIAAAGHGGQILLSQAARDLAGGDALRDLGEHRLKDLASPERIYQLGDGDFPPLKSLNNSNLPLPAEPMIGRKKELADVLRVFREGARLVTVTGPGGIGKTRFALDLASELLDQFRDGVWWVGLAPVRDAALVLSSVGAAVGARADLSEHFRQKQAFLLLDNFEHVVAAAGELAELQSRCRDLVLLVTSREALHIAGEREYPLAPLPASPAVELFRQRAEAAAPDFDADYAELVLLCDRLDRLPLAIELAAARVKALPVRALLERFEQRLPLLTSRRRDIDDRQRTLHATIEWSYDLLMEDEKHLFARLAVFAGSFDTDATAFVCNASLDALESLLDKSLLRRTSDERFFMLQTIREFALERFAAMPDEAATRDCHAAYFANVVCMYGEILELGPRTPEVLDRFEREHNNVRAALEHVGGAGDDAQTFARTVGRFWPFWWLRGHVSEGREWLDMALARAEAGSDAHFEGLEGAAHLAHVQGDQARCQELASVFLLLARKNGDERRIGMALHLLANAAIASGSVEEGMALDEESLQHLEAGDRYSRYPRSGLAYVAMLLGDYQRGATLMADVLAFDREVGDVEGISNDLGLLAIAAAQLGRDDEAIRLLRESASVAASLGHVQVLGNRVLLAGAVILGHRGQPEHAVEVLCAVRAWAGRRGGDGSLGPLGEAVYEQTWKAAAGTLAPEAVAAISNDVNEQLVDRDVNSFVGDVLRALD
jgi:predicted ATPase